MKTTFKIALLELKTLFSSPIAWLLLVIFTVQNSLDLISLLKTAIIKQGMSSDPAFQLKAFITAKTFGKDNGLFGKVIGHWYLYIPLLTMGLMSRELSSGNIKLLFSSPVKIREIVLGKFTGIMLYWTLLMGVLLIFVLCGYLFITGFELPMVLSGLLGVYLVAMLYSSIGLFVSCLTTYQIVAAISTFMVLAALDYFGGLWQGVPFIRDLTWFINTGAHTENLLDGLIVSRDVAYFVILTVMFIILSAMVLESMVHFRSIAAKTCRYLVLLTLSLLAGYGFSRPQVTLYADVTADRINTLSPTGQETLNKIKGPVKITLFNNIFVNFSGIGRPDQVNYNIKKWEPYKRFLPQLELDYVNFYDTDLDSYYTSKETGKNIGQAAKAEAKLQEVDFESYLPPGKIRKMVDLSAYNNRTVYRISNGGKAAFMRRPTDINYETYVIANFRRMQYGADTLAFLAGNNEPSIENEGENDFKETIYKHNNGPKNLQENGFEAFSHDPVKPIPSRTSVLVIANPVNPYSQEALKNIRDYLDKGGNALILKGSNEAKSLEPLTAALGVGFMTGQLVQPNEKQSANHLVVNFQRSSLKDTTYFSSFWNYVRLTDATALTYKPGGPFKIAPVLMTDMKSTWNKMLESELDTGGLHFHPEQGDIQQSLPVALALTRRIKNKEQRIMVVGSTSFLEPRVGDQIFRNTVFRWFSYGKFPLNKLSPDPKESDVLLSYKQSDLLKYVLIIGICGFLILFGSIYLMKRRSL